MGRDVSSTLHKDKHSWGGAGRGGGSGGGGGEATRSRTEKRCSHNLQSGHPTRWPAEFIEYCTFLEIDLFLKQEAKRQRKNNVKNDIRTYRICPLELKL